MDDNGRLYLISLVFFLSSFFTPLIFPDHLYLQLVSFGLVSFSLWHKKRYKLIHTSHRPLAFPSCLSPHVFSPLFFFLLLFYPPCPPLACIFFLTNFTLSNKKKDTSRLNGTIFKYIDNNDNYRETIIINCLL